MPLSNHSEELLDQTNTSASSGSSTNTGIMAVGKVGITLINGATAPSTPTAVTIGVSQDDTDYIDIVKDLEGPADNNGEQHYEIDVSGWQYIQVDMTATDQNVTKRAHLSGIENS